MLEVSNDVVGKLENVFRLGKLSKGTHTCKYTFNYVENGNSHTCFMVDSADKTNRHNLEVSMGVIKLNWNDRSWSFKDYHPDREYLKIFIDMLKCVERELEIKLPETLFK